MIDTRQVFLLKTLLQISAEPDIWEDLVSPSLREELLERDLVCRRKWQRVWRLALTTGGRKMVEACLKMMGEAEADTRIANGGQCG